MSDVLRVVTFSSGYRPVLALDLNSEPGTVTAYFRERGSFQFTPAVGTVQYSKQTRRFGGARAVGETHDNGSISWTAYVRGSTLSAATANVEALVTQIEDVSRGKFVEWAPEGGLSSFFEIAGPGSWVPAYNPVEFVQTNAMRVQLTFPTLPLVRWVSPTIGDDYTVDTIADYTFDAGTTADLSVVTAQAKLAPIGASLTTERRIRHTARGYSHLEGQASIKFTVGTVRTSFKAGVILRATDANNYVEAYVDDNGTNSRLRIDVVIGGVRTNRVSVNLAVRMTTSTSYWMRARVRLDALTGSAQSVLAEHFTSQPGSLTAPTNSTSYALISGDAPLNTTAGQSGISFIPQDTGASVTNFEFAPYALNDASGMTAPRIWTPMDNFLGTAPPLADVTLSTSGGTLQPVFALIAWSQRATTPVAGLAPFNVMASAAASTHTGVVGTCSDSTNWSASTIPADLSGQVLSDSGVSGVETYTAAWLLDPSTLPPDDFSDEIMLEFWARMMFSSTVVSPTVVPSIRSAEGTSFGAERHTNEWGVIGQVLAASGFRQFYRLGTISVPASRTYRRTVKFWLTLITGAGSTGTVVLDHIIVLPVRQRCLSPTGKILDSSYPSFIASTTATDKTVRSDLSGLVSSQTGAKMLDHGLGGNLIEPPSGAVDWIVKLSVQVPGDPTSQVASESSSQNCSLRIDYVPRSYMLRTI